MWLHQHLGSCSPRWSPHSTLLCPLDLVTCERGVLAFSSLSLTLLWLLCRAGPGQAEKVAGCSTRSIRSDSRKCRIQHSGQPSLHNLTHSHDKRQRQISLCTNWHWLLHQGPGRQTQPAAYHQCQDWQQPPGLPSDAGQENPHADRQIKLCGS